MGRASVPGDEDNAVAIGYQHHTEGWDGLGGWMQHPLALRRPTDIPALGRS